MSLFLAILLALIGTILVNYSGYMQKRELNHLPRLELHGLLGTLKAFVSDVSWLEAQGLLFLGTFIHSLALIFGPLSIVAPIHTSGVVLLAILAIVKLNEKPSKTDWAGVGSIILGLIFLGISLAGTKGSKSAHNTFFVWFFIVLLYTTAGICFINAFRNRKGRESVLIAIGTGILLGLNDILEKLFWPDMANRLWVSGLGSALKSPYLYMIIAIAVITLFMTQVALQRGKAIIVIPVVNSLANLIPILVGLMAFGEPFPASLSLIFVRLLSIVMIIGGAVLLSLKKGDEKEPGSQGARELGGQGA